MKSEGNLGTLFHIVGSVVIGISVLFYIEFFLSSRKFKPEKSNKKEEIKLENENFNIDKSIFK